MFDSALLCYFLSRSGIQKDLIQKIQPKCLLEVTSTLRLMTNAVKSRLMEAFSTSLCLAVDLTYSSNPQASPTVPRRLGECLFHVLLVLEAHIAIAKENFEGSIESQERLN
jgi:hypothetical protein